MSVGNFNKIEPAFLVEEKLDFLIIGDLIEGEEIPSLELQEWLIQFSELCNKNQVVLKSISSYYVSSMEIEVEHHWINFFRDINFPLALFPPILRLKMKEGGLTLEKKVLKSIKDYSNEFIEFFIKNKKGGI